MEMKYFVGKMTQLFSVYEFSKWRNKNWKYKYVNYRCLHNTIKLLLLLIFQIIFLHKIH